MSGHEEEKNNEETPDKTIKVFIHKQNMATKAD